jgi:2-keto-4-pentenoate hydratase
MLQDAYALASPIEPMTSALPGRTLDGGYDIRPARVADRMRFPSAVRRGAGLTPTAMRRQPGVHPSVLAADRAAPGTTLPAVGRAVERVAPPLETGDRPMADGQITIAGNASSVAVVSAVNGDDSGATFEAAVHVTAHIGN